MFKQAVESIEKIVEAMDASREGLKACKSDHFTEDQKLFLLVSIFGFSGVEVGRMFNQDHKRVSLKVKRMSDKYAAAFKEPVPKSAYAGLSSSEISERMAL